MHMVRYTIIITICCTTYKYNDSNKSPRSKDLICVGDLSVISYNLVSVAHMDALFAFIWGVVVFTPRHTHV